MVDTPTMAKEHMASLIFPLENLIYIINYPKFLMTPTQKLNFLGFVINSTNIKIRMPGKKIKQVRLETRKLQGTKSPSALILFWLLRKLSHAAQAIP